MIASFYISFADTPVKLWLISWRYPTFSVI